MKRGKYIIIILITLISSFSGFGMKNISLGDSKRDCFASEDHSTHSNSQMVYICTGLYAYAYHSSSTCAGLSSCRGDIKYVDEYTAINIFGRKPCCRCWTNAGGDCKEDNLSYGTTGGGTSDNSEAYGYLALAVVATGAILLSNDFYIYPTYSFSKNFGRFPGVDPSDFIGISFGCRKTFKHSALEYGASYLRFSTKFYDNTNGLNTFYSGTIENKIWGEHLNFVQQIFYYKTPQWLKLYLGPSINHVIDYGYGGIVGVDFKLFDRLKFDIRYEYTTQTNQIQAGIIFTFQKKYFWRRK